MGSHLAQISSCWAAWRAACNPGRSNVGLLLVQRRRRWPNNKPTLDQRLAFAMQESRHQGSLPLAPLQAGGRESLEKTTSIPT